MLDHLCVPENRIEVVERITDRNEDIIAELVIGSGYGIFRGLNQVEYVGGASASFSHVGTLVFYTSADPTEIVVAGKTYTTTHTKPQIGDKCVWRGTSYIVTGVNTCPDIHGDLVGFTILCDTGN